MTRSDFLSFNDQPCRFRLRTGKEIFGVIRESSGSYYFSTLGERMQKRPVSVSENIGQAIALEDVIYAELLSGSDLMVG